MIRKHGKSYPGIISFKRQINQHKKSIRDAVREAMRTITMGVLDQAINYSPVWTGSYVRSHRVGHGSESERSWTNLHTGLDLVELIDHMGRPIGTVDRALDPEAALAAKQQAYETERLMIKSAPLHDFDKFVLDNKTPYGLDVEVRHSVYARTGNIGRRIAEECLKVIVLK